MTSIEERIVSLGFNNKSFEQHAAQSMSTLDKLDHMLNSFGGSKGMDLLNNALEAVTSKFSVMGTIGDQVLRRIADTAMNAANSLIQMGKSMSIDQVTAGWGKYEQKTASVQTIMNATGDSIEKVNEYLSDLMWYSDETSFGFTDMTSALGQMTSSGGKVENLIPLLMGVGNAVAYAGKGASEFSRVVYNLNQSYGAGALQLMDWKSLELAGVASKELKQAFIDVAIAQGKIKEGDVTIANFSQTLSKKWADTSVIEAAFGKFAEMTTEAKRLIDAGVYRNATEAYQALASKYGEVAVKAAQSAQEAKSFAEAIDATKDAVSSGWLTTFEHIFGNYEEAKKLWTDLTDVLWEMFAAGAEMRNEVLERWHNAKVGGYQTLIEALENVFEVITKLTNLTRGGLLKVIFGSKGDDVHALTLMLINATRAFKFFSEDLLQFTNNLERFNVIEKIFAGLHATFVALKTPLVWLKQAFVETFKPLFSYNGNQIKWPRDLAIMLSQLSGKFMEFGISLNKWIGSSTVVQSLSNLAWGIASVFEFIYSGIKSFVDQIRNNFEPEVHKFRIDTILDSLSKFGALLLVITSSLKDSGALNTFVSILLETFGLFGDIFDIVSIIVNSLLGTLIGKSGDAGNFINGILQAILKVITSIRSALNWLIENDGIESSIGGIGFVLSKVFDILSKVVNLVISHNPFELLANGAKKAYDYVSDFVKKMKESFSSVFSGENKLGGNIFSIAGTISLLGLAIKKFLTGKSIKEFADNLNGFFDNGILGLLTGNKFGETFGKTLESVRGAINSFANGTNAKALKDVAIGLGILTASLLVLSLMDLNKLAASMLVLTVGLGEMIGTLAILQTIPKINKGVTTDLLKIAGAMLLFAMAVGTVSVAMLVMAAALKVLSSIDPTSLVISILAVITTLAAVTLALTVLSKFASGRKMLAAGASILMLSVGILVLTAALAALSLIPYDKLQNGITALAFALIIVGGALALLSLVGAKVLLAAGSILIVSAAIIALTAALVVLAMIPGEALAKGLLMIAGALAVMVAALLILSLVGPMALMAGGALLMLGTALAIASVGMLIIAVALRVLKPLANSMPKIAGGLALIGASMLALGVGGLVAGLGLVGFAAMIPLAFALSLLRGLELAKIAGGLALLGAAMIPLGIGGLALLVGAPGLLLGGLAFIAFGLGLQSLSTGLHAMEGIKAGTMLEVAAGVAALGLAGSVLLVGALGLGLGAPALIEFASALPPLAEGLHTFETINWDTIGKAFVIFAESVGALFVLQFATIRDGVPTLIELANAMPILADGFSSFANAEVWLGLPAAADALKTAISSLFKLQFSTIRDGTPTLIELSKALPSLSDGFKSFGGLDAEMIIRVGDAMSTVIKSLFKLQFSSLIDGTDSLISLGNALPILAAGFRAFEGLDPEWIRSTAISLADGIKALTGDFLSNLFKGSPDFAGLANGILQIAMAVSSIPADAGTRLTDIANGLTVIAATVDLNMQQITLSFTTLQANVETISSVIIMVITTMCDQIVLVMTMMTSNVENMVQSTLQNVTLKVMTSLAGISVTVVTYMSSIRFSIQNALSSIELIFSDSLSRLINSLNATASEAYSAGVSIGQNLADGLWSQVAAVQEAANALAAAAGSSSGSVFSSSSGSVFSGIERRGGFQKTKPGEYTITGFKDLYNYTTISGFKDLYNYTNAVFKGCGKEAGNSFSTGVRAALGIHSPSKVMEKIGKFTMLGFANGLGDESSGVSNGLLRTIDPILAAITSLMSEDLSPTITPVMDMTNINDAASEFANLFDSSASYALSSIGNISANTRASRISSETNQNGIGGVGDTITNTINVYAQPGQDVNELARVIEQRLVRLNKQQRLGALG